MPLTGLLSDGFAATRRALITGVAATSPVAPGDPYPFNGAGGASVQASASETRAGTTTHLTTADRHGNVVSYTFTIESTGGAGLVVPGWGFLANNELTDFNFDSLTHPNRVEGGKRPRSSMAPTIVLRDGDPLLAVGSPGGSTIITTVLQILIDRLDLGLTLPQAIADPRLTQRNTAATQAEPGFFGTAEATALGARGHVFTRNPEIGAATGIEFLGAGRHARRGRAGPARRRQRDGGHPESIVELHRRPGGAASRGSLRRLGSSSVTPRIGEFGVALGDAALGPVLGERRQARAKRGDVGAVRESICGDLDPELVDESLDVGVELVPLLGDDRDRAHLGEEDSCELVDLGRRHLAAREDPEVDANLERGSCEGVGDEGDLGQLLHPRWCALLAALANAHAAPTRTCEPRAAPHRAPTPPRPRARRGRSTRSRPRGRRPGAGR